MDTLFFIPGDELKRGVVIFGETDRNMLGKAGTVDVRSFNDLCFLH